MSFLSVLQGIGNVLKKVGTIAASPQVVQAVQLIGGPVVGLEYAAATNIIVQIENLIPQSGEGTTKLSAAILALQNVFPNATAASLATLASGLVTAFNGFAAANSPAQALAVGYNAVAAALDTPASAK